VFVLFHYQNNFEMNYSSSIWWRHLPAAYNNFFEAGVSGNKPATDIFFSADSPILNYVKQFFPEKKTKK
jgi:hypothetical protein